MRTSLLVFGDAAAGERSSVKVIIAPLHQKKNKTKNPTIETSPKAVSFDRQKYGLAGVIHGDERCGADLVSELLGCFCD